MSKSGAGEEGAPQQGAGDPNKKDPNADLYETKKSKKVLRLITVVAYMVSVSFVAIVLSAYYLFLWVPPDPRLLRRPVHMLGDPELQFLVGDAEISIEEADKLRGRTVDDDSNETSRLSKRHQILDQSLLMLKLYLTDQQRNRTKYDSAGSISTKETVESETRSPTIFGDQANGQGVAKDQTTEHVPANSPIKIETVVEKTSENVTEDEAWPAKDVRNHRMDSFHEESSSTIGPVTFVTKSTVVATNGKDPPRAMGNRPAINSSRKWKFADRPELKPPSRAFASSAMNLREALQLETEMVAELRRAEGTRRIMQLPRKMSAQNLSPEKTISETGSRENKPAGNEIRFAGDERKDKLYEPKHKRKMVRVLTVVAYVIFVSMGAILLSLYYTFVWDPKDVTVRIRSKPECVDTKLLNPLTTPSGFNETQAEKTTVRSVPDRNQQTEEPETVTTSTMSSLRTNSSTTLTGFLFTEEQKNVLKQSNVDSVGFLDNSNNEDRRKSLTNTSSEND